jgi:hypothetical protein
MKGHIRKRAVVLWIKGVQLPTPIREDLRPTLFQE